MHIVLGMLTTHGVSLATHHVASSKSRPAASTTQRNFGQLRIQRKSVRPWIGGTLRQLASITTIFVPILQVAADSISAVAAADPGCRCAHYGAPSGPRALKGQLLQTIGLLPRRPGAVLALGRRRGSLLFFLSSCQRAPVPFPCSRYGCPGLLPLAEPEVPTHPARLRGTRALGYQDAQAPAD